MQGDVFADAIPSDSSRIAAQELKGDVGDPWLPVDLGDSSRGQDVGEEKALTFPARGITTETLRRLVFRDGVRLTNLQEPLDHWQEEVWFTVSVLIRGHGSTERFHEGRVMVPRHVQRRIFEGPGQREPIVQLSRSALEYAGKMQHSRSATSLSSVFHVMQHPHIRFLHRFLQRNPGSSLFHLGNPYSILRAMNHTMMRPWLVQ